MKKTRKKIYLTLGLLIMLLTLSGCETVDTSLEKENKSDGIIKIATNENLQEVFRNSISEAKTIKIHKKFIAFNNSYNIIIDGEKKYTIDSEYFPLINDSFVIRDLNGNDIFYEKQKSRHWNLSFNRGAIIYDASNDKEIGYIGEEQFNDLLSLNHKFHFYNEEQENIAETKKDIISIGHDSNIYDNDNNLIYKIEGHLSYTSDYTIKKIKESNIPEEQVIFYTVILDAIYNAEQNKNAESENS